MPVSCDVMSGAIIYPACRQDCDFAVLFIEVSDCLPMCGVGTIGLVTSALEAGLVTPQVPGQLSIETPTGSISATPAKVTSVKMLSVASYLHAQDVVVDVEGLGRLSADIAYGGNYYAVVEPQATWAGLDGMPTKRIVELSQSLRSALAQLPEPVHPEDSRIRGVHHGIWCDQLPTPDIDGRCAVFYGDQAIEPAVTGWARGIVHNTIFVDDNDPLAHGLLI
ncbi:proline racemase family protein [Pseudomonas sp. LJDD11]|uniref:proline racemase family protein n=1 Tax=Pseudomonas sp. LJDD11 TaxID=2931984 RepID=UPI00211B8BA6|nr:proline racemase family protein [Pseudomonas sp. LJDD11]MCQ9422363.1 proline racemase family protein [Pseudomonas sp. LJDD11]